MINLANITFGYPPPLRDTGVCMSISDVTPKFCISPTSSVVAFCVPLSKDEQNFRKWRSWIILYHGEAKCLLWYRNLIHKVAIAGWNFSKILNKSDVYVAITSCFDILLTVHLSIILVINQPDDKQPVSDAKTRTVRFSLVIYHSTNPPYTFVIFRGPR